MARTNCKIYSLYIPEVLKDNMGKLHRKGGFYMLEKYLIHHCSPTLASLKTASIFRCPFTSDEELDEQLKSWNQQFAKKGIVLF